MNSTEPGPNFEKALVYIQYFNGVIMLAFNGSIVALIIGDEDVRNKHYRKYLCCLQISSLAFDTFSDFYAPIVQIHKGIFYSNSLLSNVISIGKFCAFELQLYAEVILVYFACVYYRRGIVLPPERRFNYFGWQRKALFVFLQVYAIVAIGAMVFYMNKSIQAADRHLPPELLWVRSKTTYIFIKPDDNMKHANFLGASAGVFPIIAGFLMIAQLVQEVKKGMRNSSVATRRYQQMAGAVPSLVYLIPSFANTALQMAPSVFDTGVVFDKIAMVLSPILFMVNAKHTLVSSLTILYCCPNYRRKIVDVLLRRKNSSLLRITDVSKSQSTMC